MIENFTKNILLQFFTCMLLLFVYENAWSQQSEEVNKIGKKYKSYNAFNTPLIEDNSFLIEEAFNQESGVIQYISTCYFSNSTVENIAYSFTQEVPLKDVAHQFSYTINYFGLQSQQAFTHGLGDIQVNYRYELTGKDNWALITPRLSLIIPSGDFKKDFGPGAWGGQFNLPLTKMLTNRLVFHYNSGFTFYKDAKFSFTDAGNQTVNKRSDLTNFNVGGSLIWMAHSKLNLMLEYVSNYNDAFDAHGTVAKAHQQIVNPGIRYAFNMGKCQIVPGFSMPIVVEERTQQTGAFVYLSIEPNYNIKKH